MDPNPRPIGVEDAVGILRRTLRSHA
jgi:hypothetical protein